MIRLVCLREVGAFRLSSRVEGFFFANEINGRRKAVKPRKNAPIIACMGKKSLKRRSLVSVC